MAKEKEIQDFFERQRKAMEDQSRAAYKLSKAFETLGDTAIKQLDENIRKLAKDAGVFNDEQLALIKTTDDLVEAIEQEEKKLVKTAESVDKTLNALNSNLKNSEKRLADAIKTGNQERIAKAKASIADQKQEIAALEAQKKSLEVFTMHTDALIADAEALDRFRKHVDYGVNALKGWVANNLTVRKTGEKLEEALKALVDDLNKATAVGLQDAFATIGIQAIKLRMSFDEFSEILAKNRDVVRQFGGGAEGIAAFTDKLKEASAPLSYMGNEGFKATARFGEVLKGVGLTWSDTSGNFSEAMGKMQKSMKRISGVFGDSYDQVADLIDAQIKSTSIQNQMINLDTKQRAQLVEEIALRTENMKQMGLNNDQIKEANARLDDFLNPRKTKITERIKGAELEKAYLGQLASMEPANKALQDAVKSMQDGIEKAKLASPEEAKKIMQSPAMLKSMQIVGAAQAKAYAGKPEEVIGLDRLRDLAGGMEFLNKQTEELAQSHAEGRDLNDKTYQKQAKQAEDSVDHQSMFTKVVADSRDVMQQWNSVMKSAVGLTVIALATGLGTLLVKTNLLGRAFSFASGMMTKSGPLGGFSKPGGGGLGGMARGAGRMMGGIGGGLARMGGAAIRAAGPIGAAAGAGLAGYEGGTSLFKAIGTLDESGGLSQDSWLAGLTSKLAGGPVTNAPTPLHLSDRAKAAIAARQAGVTPPNTAIAAPTAPIAGATAATVPTVSTNPQMDEMKKQTKLLEQIVQNTAAYRAGIDKRTFKESPSIVANQVG